MSGVVADQGSSAYAIRHAEKAKDWKPPRTGGYSAVVNGDGRFVRKDPPKAKGAATPARKSAK